jgi:hypothetical protein
VWKFLWIAGHGRKGNSMSAQNLRHDGLGLSS